MYLSADSVKADDPDEQARFQSDFLIEFLNSMEGNSSLPAHKLKFKKGFIVMLLRNIRIGDGHVNGSWYIAEGMTDRLLFLRSVAPSNYGSRSAVLRMNYVASEDDALAPGFRDATSLCVPVS